MKKILLTLIVLLLFITSFSQNIYLKNGSYDINFASTANLKDTSDHYSSKVNVILKVYDSSETKYISFKNIDADTIFLILKINEYLGNKITSKGYYFLGYNVEDLKNSNLKFILTILFEPDGLLNSFGLSNDDYLTVLFVDNVPKL